MRSSTAAASWAISFLIIFICCTSGLAQQRRSFDIATFTPPANWKAEDRGESFVISDIGSKGYCLLIVYASAKSSGKVQSDFDAAWRKHAVDRLGIQDAPKTEPPRQSEGWTYILGAAQGKNDAGPFALLITTATGFGRTISSAAILTDDGYMATVEKFLDSLKLDASLATTATAPLAPSGPVNSELVGAWTNSGGAITAMAGTIAATQQLMVHAGSFKSRYVFKSDGTYEFKSERWGGYYNSNEWWTTEESGVFSINGSSVTVTPKTSRDTQRDSNGRVRQSQNNPLEKTTYGFRLIYMEGLGRNNLILTAPSETRRDVRYTSSETYRNSFIYDSLNNLEFRY